VYFCSYIQRLLDRISNGTLPDDRRTAIVELQSVVAESNAAQLAFGAAGFPVIVGILKDQRDDLEMVLYPYFFFPYFFCSLSVCA